MVCVRARARVRASVRACLCLCVRVRVWPEAGPRPLALSPPLGRRVGPCVASVLARDERGGEGGNDKEPKTPLVKRAVPARINHHLSESPLDPSRRARRRGFRDAAARRRRFPYRSAARCVRARVIRVDPSRL